MSVKWIDTKEIKLPDWDVRFKRDLEWQKYFEEQIRVQGIRDPLHVLKQEDGYLLLEGRTRYQAACNVGISQVPCVVYEKLDVDPYVFAIQMNMLKKELSIVSLTCCFYDLYFEKGWTVAKIAGTFNLDRSHVYRLIKLNELPKEELEKIEAGLRPAFPEAHKKAHLSHCETTSGKKGGFGVRCPFCGCFPEKGKGKWIYFCPEHEDAYPEVLELIMSGEWKRRV
jgi:ParB/RepB/Spo0J family partition protein